MATSDKYDRQLRLWGATGQHRLASTTVILVQASAAGCETLKNLVLPGVGGFAVVDDQPFVTSHDATTNFFTPLSSSTHDEDETTTATPKSRAQVAMEYLQELNDDVRGEYQHVSDLLEVNYDTLLTKYTTGASTRCLVVASDLVPLVLERVAHACETHRVSLVVVQAYGLLGYVRLQCPLLPLLNPKPRDAVPDLRLSQPFPALLQMLQEIGDLSLLDNQQHSHVPYPIILLNVMHQWQQQQQHQQQPPNDDPQAPTLLPKTMDNKQAFQTLVKQSARHYDMELNYQEAFQNAYLAYSTTARALDVDHIQQLLQQIQDGENASPAILRFRCMVLGLQHFYDKYQRAPLQGTIPDMTASTEWYVQLQRLYQHQAQQDLVEFQAMVLAVAANHNVPILDEDDDEELTAFAHNAMDLDVLQTRTLQQEWCEPTVPEDLCDDLNTATMEGDERDDQIPLLWGLGLMACRWFYQQQHRYPGTEEDHWESDIDDLQACIVQVVHRYKLQDNALIQRTLLDPSHSYATELARYGNAELHNIASLIGGVASQEAVKLITGQYVPINNTYLYNGIASIGGVYRF